MYGFLSDVRHGARILARTPGVTAAALIALALAIGANTAMFTVVDAVLLRPLPFSDAERLVGVWEDASKIGFPRNTPAPANWQDWRASNTVFTDIGASRGWSYTLTGDGPPQKVPARRMTASMWSVLGSTPLIGRTFTEQEDSTNAKVAVIGYGLWMQRWGGDKGIIGRKATVDGEAFTIIGVMRPEFSFPFRRVQMWTPAAFTPAELARRGSHFLMCVARLKPGVTVEQARSEMKLIAQRLAERYPDTNRDLGAVVVPFTEEIAGQSRVGLIALFAASGFVLLIACANIANLLLARAPDRRREIAVRSALGASKSTIIRQLLTESLLLSGAGAILGIGIARLALIAVASLIPQRMAATPLGVDWRVLLFTAAIAVATGVFFGIFPAFSLGRMDLNKSLREGGRTATGGRPLFRDGLAVAQMSLALMLLTGAGLMIQTLGNLRGIDLGLRSEGLLTVSTDLTRSRYPSHARQYAFADSVLRNVRAIPGVLGAGYTSNLPLTAMGNTNGYLIPGQTPQTAANQDALMRVVTPDLMETLGARLREGRFFTEADRPNTEPVAIVNETFANRHWPGQSAVGPQVKTTSKETMPWMRIVGVVREIRERGINIDTKPAIYVPHAQSEPHWPIPADLVIRTAVKPESVTAAVQQAIWAVDRDQPLSNVRTMEDVIDEQLARERQQSIVLSVFGGLAVLLAATGLYGVISYAVTRRRREFGIRMALGATPADIMRTVLGRGSAVILAGVATGVVLSLVASRLIAVMLYGVKPGNPGALTAAAILLGVVGVIACAAPARAAAIVQPSSVLRDE